MIFVNDKKMAGNDDPLMPFEYAQGGGNSPFPVVHARRELVDQLLASSDTTLADLEAQIDKDLKPHSFA